MKRKTIKILVRTTANEVEILRNRLDEAEQKIFYLVEQQQKNYEFLNDVQKLADDNNQKVAAILKSNLVNQVAVKRKFNNNQKINRTDLEARDREFLKKVGIIKQAQSIIRAKYAEQKKKSVWQKLLPNWVSFKIP